MHAASQRAILLSKDDIFNGRSKHVYVKYHLVRDHCKKGSVELKFLRTGDMVADLLNTPLAPEKHLKFRDALGMRTTVWSSRSLRMRRSVALFFKTTSIERPRELVTPFNMRTTRSLCYQSSIDEMDDADDADDNTITS